MPSSQIRVETLRDARSFVRYWDEIAALREELNVTDDILLNPLHFLTATDDTRRSCSVACWDGDRFLGLLYATDHYVRGMRSGYAVGGDFTGRGLLLCRAEDEEVLLRAAIEEMVRSGIHSIHLRLLPRDAAQVSLPGVRIKHLDALIPGDRMTLLSSFEEFLGTLGKHTRRNVRYYTRKAEAAGIEFAASLTRDEYQAGLDRLNAVATFRADTLRLIRDERLLALHSGAQRLGLRAADGNLVAVLCGFSQGGRFHLLTQLNDVNLEALSLSVVLRGYTVEHLIATGHSELQFMGGTSLSFGRFCAPQTYRSIFIDKAGGVTALAKRFAGKLVEVSARMGRPIPEALKMICNGHLDEPKLIERTALGPAAVAFQREHSS